MNPGQAKDNERQTITTSEALGEFGAHMHQAYHEGNVIGGLRDLLLRSRMQAQQEAQQQGQRSLRGTCSAHASSILDSSSLSQLAEDSCLRPLPSPFLDSTRSARSASEREREIRRILAAACDLVSADDFP
mmetsp:Transcript_8826/g.20412  ORF Transcript_8826/g.20412 Transcript_8826/m.20412 type:complete len:131 (+) Transcript_8826:2-394(+)